MRPAQAPVAALQYEVGKEQALLAAVRAAVLQKVPLPAWYEVHSLMVVAQSMPGVPSAAAPASVADRAADTMEKVEKVGVVSYRDHNVRSRWLAPD